jgi:hypothetical protein
MKATSCKCCGHPIVSDEISAALTPLQRRIFNVVKNAGTAGIRGKDVMDIVYADDINGGPDNTNIIAVVASQANRRLVRFGVKISGRRGPGGGLKLEKLPPAEQRFA